MVEESGRGGRWRTGKGGLLSMVTAREEARIVRVVCTFIYLPVKGNRDVQLKKFFG